MKDKELREILKAGGVLANYKYLLETSCEFDDLIRGTKAAKLEDRVEKLEATVTLLLDLLQLKEIDIEAHSEIVPQIKE